MSYLNVTVDVEETKRWYNEDGKLHREDGPAVEYASGAKMWYVDGKLHRVEGPAIESPDGSEEWYLDGSLHRIGSPAVTASNSWQEWWENGDFIRAEQKSPIDFMKSCVNGVDHGTGDVPHRPDGTCRECTK